MSCKHNLSYSAIADESSNKESGDEICEIVSNEKNDSFQIDETKEFSSEIDRKCPRHLITQHVKNIGMSLSIVILVAYCILFVQYEMGWGQWRKNIIDAEDHNKEWTGMPYIEDIEWGLQNLKNGTYVDCVKFINASHNVYFVESPGDTQHLCLEFVRVRLIQFIDELYKLVPRNSILDENLKEARNRWMKTKAFLFSDLNSYGLSGGYLMTVNDYAVMVLQDLFDFVLSTQSIRKDSVTQFLKTVVPKDST